MSTMTTEQQPELSEASDILPSTQVEELLRLAEDPDSINWPGWKAHKVAVCLARSHVAQTAALRFRDAEIERLRKALEDCRVEMEEMDDIRDEGGVPLKFKTLRGARAALKANATKAAAAELEGTHE